MQSYILKPTVNEIQEFIEISNDFANPLEVVREAISNAWDAWATKTEIIFNTEQNHGETILVITIRDNGDGMDQKGLQAFYDLGNSQRRNDPNTIGEKGHGTKVYFNSSSIEVTTTKNKITLHAIMEEPFRCLSDHRIPEVKVEQFEFDRHQGTEIIIRGFHNNRREQFTHDILKDYVLWFTKFGSIETIFASPTRAYNKLLLKGLDRPEPEVINFGHYFPPDSVSVQKLFEDHMVQAPDHYCKRIVKTGHLKRSPEIEYQAIFCIEGTKVKYSYNNMIRRPRYNPRGSYTIQERYGLWLCKDYIPIQRKNEWITFKGSEYTRFHAFVNCQALRLTANRGSVENTPGEILLDIKNEVNEIYREIIEGDDWRNIEWLEDETEAYSTQEKEKKDFDWRVKKAHKANIAEYKGYTLIEPERESGVFALLIQLNIIEPNLFPFNIVDYDTHSGFDVIVKGNDTIPIYQSKLFYVELKYLLQVDFNHSFDNLHSIVCWDTKIKDGDTVVDISKQEREMKISIGTNPGSYTKYFLDHTGRAHKIEVYVLKDYLREKLGIEFRPRASEPRRK
jgi:hypothetical protein